VFYVLLYIYDFKLLIILSVFFSLNKSNMEEWRVVYFQGLVVFHCNLSHNNVTLWCSNKAW
jgi:hypothetical protein